MPLKHTITVDASHDRAKDVVGIGILVQVTDKPRKRGDINGDVDRISDPKAFMQVFHKGDKCPKHRSLVPLTQETGLGCE